MIWEVDEKVLCSHQLHDRVSQKLHPLIVAPGQETGKMDG